MIDCWKWKHFIRQDKHATSWRYDFKNNDTQHNLADGTQNNETQHCDTQHNNAVHNDTLNKNEKCDTQHNDTQHNSTQNNNKYVTFSKETFSKITPNGYAGCHYAQCSIYAVMPSVVILNVVASAWYPASFRPKIVNIRLA